MVTIAQDSLNITSPDFTVPASRSGTALNFTDNDPPSDPPSDPGDPAVLSAIQTAGTLNAGMVPFDLGGSWTIQAGPKGSAGRHHVHLDGATL
jgi:hypothetical protein